MANEFNQSPQQSAEVQMAVNQALTDQKKKKKKKRLIIVAIIAIVIIIGIVASSGGSSDEKPNTGASSNSSISAEKEETNKNEIGHYACEVKSAKVCKNWEGKDSVKITYLFTNNDDEAQSFDIALSDEVYQDGVQLESSFISSDDDDWGIDVKIKTGMTKEVSKVYILRDKTTPLDVEISEWISFDDEKLTFTVDLD